MNRFEIRDILAQHKEHFRVLPTNAMNDLVGIIDEINSEEGQKYQDTVIAIQAADDAELKQEKVSVVGKRTRKDKKKSARSK